MSGYPLRSLISQTPVALPNALVSNHLTVGGDTPVTRLTVSLLSRPQTNSRAVTVSLPKVNSSCRLVNNCEQIGPLQQLRKTLSSTLLHRVVLGINRGGISYVVLDHTAGGGDCGGRKPAGYRLVDERSERGCGGPDDRGGARCRRRGLSADRGSVRRARADVPGGERAGRGDSRDVREHADNQFRLVRGHRGRQRRRCRLSGPGSLRLWTDRFGRGLRGRRWTDL